MFYAWLRKLFSNQYFNNLFIFAILFFSLTSPTGDTDLGWRLKYGEYIWQHRALLNFDIFSWTMPHFAWFDISWPFDMVIYLLFTNFGFAALSFFAGLLIISFFYLSTKSFKLSFPQLFITFLLFSLYLWPMLSSGLRPQLLTLLGISILSYLIYEIQKGRIRLTYFFPLVILAWVNLHGTFLLGLAMVLIFSFLKIAEFFLVDDLRRKKIPLKKILTLLVPALLSVSVLVLQPDGFHLLYQISQYLPTQRISGVSEWYPIPINTQEWLLLLAWTIAMLVLVLKKRGTVFGLYQALITLLFSYFAFNSRRMFGPFFLATLPFLLENLQSIKIKSDKKTLLIVSAILGTGFLINGILVRFPQSSFMNISWKDYCRMGAVCSLNASDYLKKNPLPDRSFTYYNTGGFTIWNNPNSKIFVDGRMDQWQKDGYSPFTDHQKILNEDDLALFEKYNFQGVYLPPTFRLYSYLKRKERDGIWKLVYEDSAAAIFVRKR